MIKNQENAVTGCGMNNVTRGIRTSFLGSVGPNFCRTTVGQNGTRNWNPRLESRLGGFSGPNVLSFLDRNLQRNSYQRTTFSLGAKTTTSLTTEGKKMSFIQSSINALNIFHFYRILTRCYIQTRVE